MKNITVEIKKFTRRVRRSKSLRKQNKTNKERENKREKTRATGERVCLNNRRARERPVMTEAESSPKN